MAFSVCFDYNFTEKQKELMKKYNISSDTSRNLLLNETDEKIKLLNAQAMIFQKMSQVLTKKMLSIGIKIGKLNKDNNRITRNIGLKTLIKLFSCNNKSRRAFSVIFNKCKMRLETFVNGSTLKARKQHNDAILDHLKNELSFCQQQFDKSNPIYIEKSNDASAFDIILYQIKYPSLKLPQGGFLRY